MDIHIYYERTNNNPAQRGTNYEGSLPIKVRRYLQVDYLRSLQFSFRDSYGYFGSRFLTIRLYLTLSQRLCRRRGAPRRKPLPDSSRQS